MYVFLINYDLNHFGPIEISGQIETTYKDGRSRVQYLGGAVKTKYPDGREEAQWPDGTKLWTDGNGHGVMTFPSGIRELYTPICKVINFLFIFY